MKSICRALGAENTFCDDIKWAAIANVKKKNISLKVFKGVGISYGTSNKPISKDGQVKISF